jgi:predicted RNA-binding protein with PIN domain
MSSRRLIIDGYSLMHRDPELKALLGQGLSRAREALIEKVARTATAMADLVTVVFDGQESGRGTDGHGSIEIVYSPSGQTADTVIERLVRALPNPTACTVVTNDRRERETVTAAGAMAMSCAVFIEECTKWQRDQQQALRRKRTQHPGPKLGDYFPS